MVVFKWYVIQHIFLKRCDGWGISIYNFCRGRINDEHT